MIKLEKFTTQDFDRLINWIDNEEMLVQFSGPIFKFPLTNVQLENYITIENSFAFKVINLESNEVIGHCEIYKSENNTAKLCRILIGDERFRGKGIGVEIVNELVKYCYQNLNIDSIELNVYDWNKSAIKCYEKTGFEINPNKISQIEVNGIIWISLNMTLVKTK